MTVPRIRMMLCGTSILVLVGSVGSTLLLTLVSPDPTWAGISIRLFETPPTVVAQPTTLA